MAHFREVVRLCFGHLAGTKIVVVVVYHYYSHEARVQTKVSSVFVSLAMYTFLSAILVLVGRAVRAMYSPSNMLLLVTE